MASPPRWAAGPASLGGARGRGRRPAGRSAPGFLTLWNIRGIPVEPFAAPGRRGAQVGAAAVDPTRVCAREMSGVATRLVVGYLRGRAGEAAVAAALARAGER